MPYMAATAAMLTGASATPLSGWTYRLPQRNAQVEVMINATATGLVWSFSTGSELIVAANTPISGGGVAGTLPARINSEAVVDRVGQSEELVLTINNPTGGTITYNLVVVETYI